MGSFARGNPWLTEIRYVPYGKAWHEHKEEIMWKFFLPAVGDLAGIFEGIEDGNHGHFLHG
jgi:hypothetical protein